VRYRGFIALMRRGRADWPDDLREIVYVDHFGNAMTGAAMLPPNARLAVAGRVLERARKRSLAGRGLLVREFERAFSALAVARTSRSSATGSIDNSPGGIFLH
jgi:hypothetical protein